MRERLTASGCGLPRCHVMAICIQDWLISGRVSMMVSIVTASLSSGGGCLMVQGVFGIQAHQSNWKNISRNRDEKRTLAVHAEDHFKSGSTCPLLVAACCTEAVKMATDSSVQSSSLLQSFEGRPEHTDSQQYNVYYR